MKVDVQSQTGQISLWKIYIESKLRKAYLLFDDCVRSDLETDSDSDANKPALLWATHVWLLLLAWLAFHLSLSEFNQCIAMLLFQLVFPSIFGSSGAKFLILLPNSFCVFRFRGICSENSVEALSSSPMLKVVQVYVVAAV